MDETEVTFKMKYNQERIVEIEYEIYRLQGWHQCLINERTKLLQQNQQLRQIEQSEEK